MAVAAAASLATTALAPGLAVTQVVKGCWQLSGGHRGDAATDRTAGRAALEDFTAFYNAGITTWDCADHYGPAENLIGKWIREGSEASGTDLRVKVQVLTKVCVFDSVAMATVTQGSMRAAVDLSVRRLGGSPSLLQFYWGAYEIPRYVDAAKYLAEEQAQGKFGYLAVTNFDVPRLEQMVDAGVPLVANQLQYSLLDRRPENGMAQYCAAKGIKLLPYGVLAGGLLSKKYLGAAPSAVTLDTFSKRKYSSVLQQAGGWEWYQRLLQVLQATAEKHKTSLSNVAARWVLDKPGVAGVVLGARNASHVTDQTALVREVRLDDADRSAIQEVLDDGVRPKGDCYAWERGLGPF